METAIIVAQKKVIKIGKLPGIIKVIELKQEANIGDALVVAGLDAEGYEIRVNNLPMDISGKLEDMDTVLLLKKIKGN